MRSVTTPNKYLVVGVSGRMMVLGDSAPLFARRRRHLERGTAHGGGSGNGSRGLHGTRSGEGAPTSAPSGARESQCRREKRREREVKWKEEEIPNPKIEDVSRRDKGNWEGEKGIEKRKGFGVGALNRKEEFLG